MICRNTVSLHNTIPKKYNQIISNLCLKPFMQAFKEYQRCIKLIPDGQTEIS